MTKDANIPVVMDATGNSLQRSSSRVHVYDEQGRLSQVLNPTALYADFLYNALGQRTLKRTYLTSGALDFTITHLYGADGQLLGQVRYNNLGKKTSALYWIWLDGMPLAEVEFKYNTGTGAVTSTSQYYLHSDHLNTPRLATNQAQTLLWSWDSDAFGLGNPNGDPDGDGVVVDIPLRFPGQIFEAYSNLNYNYFRDYDPDKGRYVQSDPIGLRGGLNTYGYVGGNPVLFFDQKGLWSINTGYYRGGGAEVIFGVDPKTEGKFLTLRFGYGLGAGTSFDPLGGRPGSEQNMCGIGGVSAGAYGELNFAAPFVTGSLGAEAGIQNNRNAPDEIYVGPTNGIDTSLDRGGIKTDGSAGVEISFY